MRPVVEVAKDLLGKYLIFQSPDGLKVGEINETEAYHQFDDPACHAFKGKTPRCEVLFEKGGHVYIYFIYGMYYCLNFVAEEEGVGAAVLIRSVIPIEGLEGKTDGPGKLCRAYGLTKEQNKIDAVTSDILYLEDRGKKVEFKTSTRIGISQAKEKMWRFYY